MAKSNYLFHFIISPKFNDYMNFLKDNLNFKSNCALIDYILEKLSFNYRKIKEIIGDHKSEYEFIDIENPNRVDKYVRLKEKNYKMLKKWHYLFNEYGMSVILRDMIIFFYDGILKHGIDMFLKLIDKKVNTKKIKKSLMGIMTHMVKTSLIKRILFPHVIDNLSIYV